MSQSREVCVLAPFTDHDGTHHPKWSVFPVAYESDRQRQAVNQLIHRGFLTFEVETARQYLDQADEGGEEPPEEPKPKTRRTRGSKS